MCDEFIHCSDGYARVCYKERNRLPKHTHRITKCKEKDSAMATSR